MNKKEIFSNNFGNRDLVRSERNLNLIKSDLVQYDIMENFNEDIKQQIANEVRQSWKNHTYFHRFLIIM